MSLVDARMRVLARAAEYNAQFARALDDWSDANPMKPCTACKGGVRETHDSAGKLVSITGCATCRGFGRVAMTADEIRDAYRAVRERAIARGFTSVRHFDGMVARDVQARGKTSDLAPGHWLASARRIAASMR